MNTPSSYTQSEYTESVDLHKDKFEFRVHHDIHLATALKAHHYGNRMGAVIEVMYDGQLLDQGSMVWFYGSSNKVMFAFDGQEVVYKMLENNFDFLDEWVDMQKQHVVLMSPGLDKNHNPYPLYPHGDDWSRRRFDSPVGSLDWDERFRHYLPGHDKDIMADAFAKKAVEVFRQNFVGHSPEITFFGESLGSIQALTTALHDLPQRIGDVIPEAIKEVICFSTPAALTSILGTTNREMTKPVPDLKIQRESLFPSRKDIDYVRVALRKKFQGVLPNGALEKISFFLHTQELYPADRSDSMIIGEDLGLEEDFSQFGYGENDDPKRQMGIVNDSMMMKRSMGLDDKKLGQSGLAELIKMIKKEPSILQVRTLLYPGMEHNWKRWAVMMRDFINHRSDLQKINIFRSLE